MNILIVHGDMSAGGGAEAFAAAIRDQLRDTGATVDLLDIHGLSTQDGRRRSDLRLLPGHLPMLRQLHLFKYALVCRYTRRIAKPYDKVVYSYGEGPELPNLAATLYHAPAIFSTDRRAIDVLGYADRPAMLRVLKSLYIRLCRRIAGYRGSSGDGRGLVLTNSRWSAGMIRSLTGRRTDAVIYPRLRPIPDRPAHRDRFGIVALGRLVRNKNLGFAIRLCNALRREGLPVHLTIIGRANTIYGRWLVWRYRHHPAIRFVPDASREEIAEILCSVRTGLHCYRHEHFGIAVGEMITAGVVPLVFDGGGVRELVRPRALRFRDFTDAKARLRLVIAATEAEIAALRARLLASPALHQAVNFEAQIAAELLPRLKVA